jgi:NDP-sugar pyrophosphorylase family protein
MVALEETVTAVLFSGGKGSRLFPINEFYQKVMMPIGSQGIPMLEYVIRHLKHHGIRKFVALIGYKGNQIRRYFGDGSRFDVEITYSIDLPNLKGTGGALLNAKNMIDTDNLVIYYTDILTSLNFSKFTNIHNSNKKLATVWLDPNWNENESSISYDPNKLALKMQNQPMDQPIYVNTGISALKFSVFDLLDNMYQKLKSNGIIEIDLSRDVFSKLANDGQMFGYVSNEWWLDIGSVARLSSISQSLLTRQLGHITMNGGQ